jgi:hypothetical protein
MLTTTQVQVKSVGEMAKRLQDCSHFLNMTGDLGEEFTLRLTETEGESGVYMDTLMVNVRGAVLLYKELCESFTQITGRALTLSEAFDTVDLSMMHAITAEGSGVLRDTLEADGTYCGGADDEDGWDGPDVFFGCRWQFDKMIMETAKHKAWHWISDYAHLCRMLQEADIAFHEMYDCR